MSRREQTRAIVVSALLLGSALFAELMIMLALDYWGIEGSFLRALIDGVALVLLLTPVVYFVVVKKFLEIPVIRLASTLLGSAIIAELAIMVGLQYWPIENTALRAFVDGMTLAVVLSPVVYYVIVKNILDQNAKLQRIRDELQVARSELEQRVNERTAALEAANRTLAASVAELSTRNVQSKALSEMSQLLQTCVSPAEACMVAEKQLALILPRTTFALFLFNQSRTLLERVGPEGELEQARETFAPEECWALRRNKPNLFSVNNPGSIACHHVAGVKSWHLCLPLMAQGMALGVLCLEPADAMTRGDAAMESEGERNIDFYVSVAEVLALAVANVNLRDSLREQALRDSLTGLLNRRYAIDSLDRELARAVRSREPLAVVIIDIDYFKRFNDEFGHNAGDAVLRALGRLMQKRARAEDIACRYGGEEFMMIMTGTSSDAAQHRVDALREEIARLEVRDEGRALGTITVSAGIATYPPHGPEKRVLIEAADRALYLSKHAGRNCVTVAPAPTGQLDSPSQHPTDSASAQQANQPTVGGAEMRAQSWSS